MYDNKEIENIWNEKFWEMTDKKETEWFWNEKFCVVTWVQPKIYKNGKDSQYIECSLQNLTIRNIHGRLNSDFVGLTGVVFDDIIQIKIKK